MSHRSKRIAALAAILMLAATTTPSVAPTYAAARKAPVNGRIAFATGFVLVGEQGNGKSSQIFTAARDGSDVVRLTHLTGGVRAGTPVWSPDNSTIAYSSNEGGNYAIWAMDADGANQHQVAGHPGFDFFTPNWSPDGHRLVATRCDVHLGPTLNCDLVGLRSDGSHRHRILGHHKNYFDPTYSPDGRWIAFDADLNGYVSAIWLVHPSGKGLHRLTRPQAEAFWPQWSRNGKHILFSNNCCRPRSDIFVMRVDGSHVRRLTNMPPRHNAAFASYSPDGDRILFLSDLHRKPGGANDIYKMHADGSHVRAIVTDRPNAAQSDWGSSPVTP